jgi:hypothetical protein
MFEGARLIVCLQDLTCLISVQNGTEGHDPSLAVIRDPIVAANLENARAIATVFKRFSYEIHS